MKRLRIIPVVLLLIALFPIGSAWATPRTPAPAVKPSVPPMPTIDLAVTDLGWSNSLKPGHIVGQNSILNFTLKNLGTAPSGNFIVKFTCPNCPPSMTGTQNVPSLAPGAGLGRNWPSPAAVPEKWNAGNYTLELVVDPDKAINDIDRVNNRKTLNFTVQGPAFSLKNTEINKKPPNPGTPPNVMISSLGGLPDNIYEGDLFKPSDIFVTLKNNPSTPSGPFGVTVTCDTPNTNSAPANCLTGFDNLHKQVPMLNPGQTLKVTFPAGASGIWNWGDYTIKASIDGTDIKLIKQFHVNMRAGIESLGGIPDPFYEGDSFDPASIFVLCKNYTTTALSTPFWARVTCEPIPGSGLNGTTPQCVDGFQTLHDLVPEIYPLQTYKLIFKPTGAKPWAFGRYRIMARVIGTNISTSKEIYVKSHNPVPTMSGVSVTWENLKTDYQGPCPGMNAIMLTAKITANGKGTLKWKIITQKGDYMAGVKTHVFASPGQINDWVIDGATKTETGWYAIKVLEPFAWQSPKINYTTTCVAP